MVLAGHEKARGNGDKQCQKKYNKKWLGKNKNMKIKGYSYKNGQKRGRNGGK
jgi:hypothetical protein